MIWKLLALAKGWREAFDYDGPEPLLVVWHDRLGVHYTGRGAWRAAARHSSQ